MKQLTNRFIRICVVLMLFTAISSLILNTTSAYSTNGIRSSKNTGTASQAIPVPTRNITQSMFSMGPSGFYQVNPYLNNPVEPNPMGIADYGISSNGAYQYSTNSFVGITTIDSLSTSGNDPKDPTKNDPWMGIQLNVNLVFTANNQQYVYWIQDVAQIDTSFGYINFLNNIWNFSSSSAGMSQSGVIGNGQVYDSEGNPAVNGVMYYYGAPSTLPGNDIDLQYPSTFSLNVTCGVNVGGQPTVSFGYNDGYGSVTYDTVTFVTSYPLTSFNGFVVDGYNYNPYGWFYDSELILGGPGNGWWTKLVQSNVQLQLEYWNGYNYQMITNAYNFGRDTAEGISNTLSQAYYYSDTGEMFAWVQLGSGSLSDLYYQSQVSIITVMTSVLSGTLSITSASTPTVTPWQTSFSNGEVIITIPPGSYNLQLYQNGAFYDQAECTVNAGQTLSLQMSVVATSITLLSAGTSNPLSSSDSFEVTYTLYGQQWTVPAQTGSLFFDTDLGTSVQISSVSAGSTSTEEWVLNSQGASITIPAGSTTTWYYYDLLSQPVAYIVEGSGSISPMIFYYTAPTTASSQSNPTFNSMLLPDFGQQIIWALRGTTVSVSNNILDIIPPATTAQDQWATPISSWTITQADQIYNDILYYHQYEFTTSYATSDGSVPTTAPLLSGTQFGSPYQLPLTSTSQTTWLDQNTPWSISTVVTAPSGTEQWIQTLDPLTSGTVTQAVITPILLYFHQYYLTVISPESSASGSGWYNAGSTAYAGLASGTVSYGTGAQWVFAGWTTGGNNYQQSNAITMNSAATATAVWTLQYYLTVTSAYGSPSGSGWYNAGTTANFGVTSPISVASGEQYAFASWTSSGSSSYSGNGASGSCQMNAPVTETASWNIQYYLTVPSSYGSPTGAGWYNSGATATFGVATPFSGGTGTQYLLNSWTGSGTGSYSGSATSNSLTINNAITEAASWTTQYYLTVSSSYGTPGGSGWYNAGGTAYASVNLGTISGVSGTQYVFTSWSTGGSNYAQSSGITMNAPITATASWITQYQITFAVSGNGSTSPTGSNVWANAGSLSITATPNGGYTFSNWSSDTGSITFSDAHSATTAATINGPGTITGNFSPTSTSTSTPTATPTSAPTSTPTASPSPTIPEFPNQLLEITLVVSMMIAFSAVAIAKKRRNGKIQNG